jgi:hypothetical protein
MTSGLPPLRPINKTHNSKSDETRTSHSHAAGKSDFGQHSVLRRNGIDVPELSVTFYGMTEFRIDDPDGNRLWIGQNKSSAL